MANPFDVSEFKRIFSDAHVVDVDLSEWDKRICLWVLADHFENWTARCPLVVVEFGRVREFACRLPSAQHTLEAENRHVQWRIDDSKVEQTGAGLLVRLSGSVYSPVLTIECDSISFRADDIRLLDKLWPGWNQPYSALARPSIDKLVASRRYHQ